MHRPVLTLCCVLLATAPASARPPWGPQVSLPPAAPPASPARAGPSGERRERFEAALTEGTRLLSLGQYERARPRLDEAVALWPAEVESRLARARTLLTLGYLGWQRELVVRAREDAAEALWLEPGRPGTRELVDLADHLLVRIQRTPAVKPAAKPAPARRR